MNEIAARVTCVWPERAVLGEGPCWDAARQRLLWVDIKRSLLLAWSPREATKERWQLPFRLTSLGTPPSSWAADGASGDQYFACGDRGFGRLTLGESGARFDALAHPERDDPQNRFNDGKFGPDGRYWAGTMHDPETEARGSLYAFSPDGGTAKLDEGYMVTNGPAFSRDGRTVYHTDSARQVIHAFDLQADGRLANKRAFVRFADGDGYPDGMTTDRHGNLWVAMWDGFRIDKIAPDGERLGSVAMPTARVTSCTFQDETCRVLWATSASIGLGEDDALAGGLFRIEL